MSESDESLFLYVAGLLEVKFLLSSVFSNDSQVIRMLYFFDLQNVHGTESKK